MNTDFAKEVGQCARKSGPIFERITRTLMVPVSGHRAPTFCRPILALNRRHSSRGTGIQSGISPTQARKNPACA